MRRHIAQLGHTWLVVALHVQTNSRVNYPKQNCLRRNPIVDGNCGSYIAWALSQAARPCSRNLDLEPRSANPGFPATTPGSPKHCRGYYDLGAHSSSGVWGLMIHNLKHRCLPRPSYAPLHLSSSLHLGGALGMFEGSLGGLVQEL